MEFLNNLIEYYDELYPVSKEQKNFYSNILKEIKMPAKMLGISCSIGSFEHYLARLGNDVTGIEDSKELLESANRKRRMPNTAIRFFQMSTLEMSRFLGQNFYDVISCLNSRIIFIHDKTLLKKFFSDCKSLLTKNGILVLQLGNFINFNATDTFQIPVHKSIRVNLISEITKDSSEEVFLSQKLDRNNGQFIQILKNEPITPLTPDMITEYAKLAGFNSIIFTNAWTQESLDESTDNIVCVLR